MQLENLFQNKIYNLEITQPFWYQRRESNSVNRLLQQITTEMRSSMLIDLEMDDYPWCFITANRAPRSRSFLIGAFIRTVVNEKISTKALYLQVEHSWLLARCRALNNPAFILGRALLMIETRFNGVDRQELNKLFRYLRRNIQLLGCKQLTSTEQKRLCEMYDELIKSQCSSDDMFLLENGVAEIPWKDWPSCIKRDGTAWLWRQSKYKKYIEVQKVKVT